MDTPPKRYNVLVTVNHCAPNMGSEHGVGWNFVYYLSLYHNLTIICNAHDYTQGLIDFVNSDEGKKRNIRLHLIKQNIKYKGFTQYFPMQYYADYKKWQYNTYLLVKELIKTEQFDIIHHITNITFREPGFLWQLDIPFVWGPVGICGEDRIRFLSMYNIKNGLKTILRHFSCLYQLNYSKRLKCAAQQASACIAVSKHIEILLQNKLGARRTYVLPETGAILQNMTPPPPRKANEPIQLLCLGRLDSQKGTIFLIEALRRLNASVKYKLTIVGNGDQKDKLLACCQKYNINYEYKGHVKYEEINPIYSRAHLFFITSLLDATTTVVFEALSNYCPVVALDHMPFSEIVDESCGKKISLTSKKQIYNDLSKAIEELYFDEDKRHSLSLGARKKAESYSWENKIMHVNTIYNDILSK